MNPQRPGVREHAVAAAKDRPTWSTWREALAVVVYPPNFLRTIAVALIVGTVIFAINQLDVVLSGQATASTYLKAAFTYLVPFSVSNYGILVATKRPGGGGR